MDPKNFQSMTQEELKVAILSHKSRMPRYKTPYSEDFKKMIVLYGDRVKKQGQWNGYLLFSKEFGVSPSAYYQWERESKLKSAQTLVSTSTDKPDCVSCSVPPKAEPELDTLIGQTVYCGAYNQDTGEFGIIESKVDGLMLRDGKKHPISFDKSKPGSFNWIPADFTTTKKECVSRIKSVYYPVYAANKKKALEDELKAKLVKLESLCN